MNNAILQAQQVCYDYNADDVSPVRALYGIDLDIEEGSFVAVLGHNGCGKSTFAKLCNAIALPTTGKMIVDGVDTTDDSQTLNIRRTVGMVLQNPDNQLVSTIVEEDVAFGPENLGVPPDEIRQRVDRALKTVGMYDYRLHAAHKLSGGQKQRVAIAGVLAMAPEVLVLDEPTAMLDPQGRAEVMDTVCRLSRERGMTVVLITHYMEEAALADRVVVMESGQVLLDGTPREVFAKTATLKEAALTVPQPTELCYELSRLGIPIRQDVLTVEDCVEELLNLMGEDHVRS